MKYSYLVYTVISCAMLAACGGTSQNPLRNYPKSAELAPSDPTIQKQQMPVEYVVKPEQQVVVQKEYVTKEVKVEVPVYIEKTPVVNGNMSFFSVTAPGQTLFTVGKTTSFPVMIHGLLGQLKYNVVLEAPDLPGATLTDIKVDGNNTSAILNFTPSASIISAGNNLKAGSFRIKMTNIEVTDPSQKNQDLYQATLKSSETPSHTLYYVITTDGVQTITPAQKKAIDEGGQP